MIITSNIKLIGHEREDKILRFGFCDPRFRSSILWCILKTNLGILGYKQQKMLILRLDHKQK